MNRALTKHVVLGLLIERSGYGYDLQGRFGERFRFLELTGNAIYGILNRLESDGWIEQVPDQRPARTRRGAPRVRYQPTPLGRQRFKEWIATPSPRSVMRDELQGKLRIAGDDDLPLLLEVAELQQRECLAELSEMRRPVLAHAADPDVPWSSAAAIMVDDFRGRWLQLLVDWLNSVCEIIELRIEQAGASSSAR